MSRRLSLPAALLDRALRPVISTSLATFVKPVLSPAVPFAVQRRYASAVTRASTLVPGDVSMSGERLGGIEAERATPLFPRRDVAMMYVHGGGFCIGSARSHRAIGARLARATHAPAYTVDYRLAPEHPYPAALQDVFEAYLALGARDFPHDRIALVGDSAGGGLVLALLGALRERGLPMPGSAVLLSPWLDLTLGGATVRLNAALDPLVSEAWLARCADAYRGTLAADDPRVSPLFGSLEGFPPLAIHVGTREILLDDAARLDVRARAAGLDVEYRRYAGLWHNSQLQAGVVPSADASFRDAAHFIEQRWR